MSHRVVGIEAGGTKLTVGLVDISSDTITQRAEARLVNALDPEALISALAWHCASASG